MKDWNGLLRLNVTFQPDRYSGGLTAFLKSACDASESELFSSTAATASGNEELLEEISVVYLAWKRLRKLRASNEKWSEADYVANVYVLSE
jgi:hypothetical protein